MGRYLDLLDGITTKVPFGRNFGRNPENEEIPTNTKSYATSDVLSSFMSYAHTHGKESFEQETVEAIQTPPLRPNDQRRQKPNINDLEAKSPYDQIRQKPILLNNGRRMWRFRADVILRPDDIAQRLADRARYRRAVLVADGTTLVVVERWLSDLDDETRDGLARHAGSVIGLLRGESRRRLAE